MQNGNLRKQTSKSKPNEILPHTVWDGYYLEKKKGMGKEKRTTIGKDVENVEFLCAGRGNGAALWRTVWHFLKKLKVE